MNHPLTPADYLTKILTARVYDVAVESDLEPAKALSRRLHNKVLLKREDQQPVFSFKLRGAYNKMAHLSAEQLEKGVICASAGNHAQGVALGARKLGCRAVIVMPTTTPQVKIDAVQALGGEVELAGESYSDAYKHAVKLQKEKGLTFVHPFDDPYVIAGQGTIAMEMLSQLQKLGSPRLDAVFVAIGGGGLISGVANYDYLDGFSPNVQEILTKFKFRDQIQTLVDAHVLGYLIEDFLDPEVNISPLPVKDADGRIKLPALDNHGMGTVFEELIRRFNEENNEEAGEHFTPRDVVNLMAKLLFLPVADQIQSGTYLLYDGSCGTGGMLTVADEALQELAASHDKEVSIHLFGQEINPETYAICKADLLLKGEGDEAENIVGGADKSTLSADQFRSREFDFMISNPPYGKSWKTDLDRMGGKKEFSDPRFIVNHGGDAEFKLITRSSDGQLMFLVNKLQKMKHNTPLGSRIALVHNGSALFTGDAGQGESNIRRWVLENDWLEAIIALPLNIFYNTGIATYIWVLSNRKPEHRRGKAQLIDATSWFQPLRNNLGKKNCQFSNED